MRRRVVRDLGTIAGIAVILAGVVGLNIYYRKDALTKKFDGMRRSVEGSRKQAGMELLDWELLRKTTGSLFSGPTFDQTLVAQAKEGRTSNLMGFQTPIDQFRDVTHFMLLPLPIECYFCQMPPMRDVMLVRMADGQLTNIYQDPVLISGNLNLHEGPKQKFFYSMTNSRIESGKSGAPLSLKSFSDEHKQQGYKEGGKLLPENAGTAPTEELVPGVKSDTPPAAPPAAAETVPR